jgi:hypothetical protein
MSDYRNQDYGYPNPQDTYGNNPNLDPNARAPNAAWGWIAAAVFLVVVLAAAFGFGHKPGQLGTNTASNETAPPAVTHMAPAAVPPPGSASAPGTPTPPVTAAPKTTAPGPAITPGATH